MNKRQKLVQQAFLDDEEKVIKRLKSVYNQSLKDITAKANNLQKDIEELDTLAKLSVDDEEKEKILSQRRSKVYQKQYQDSLKKQVSDILDKMQEEEFTTVAAYLDKCYEQGFVGTMYDLQGQNIPLCFPIDQEAMVKAVQLDSKISQGLYSRLGEDVNVLKKKITAQVSRGISTGMTYSQIAQQLAGHTNIGFNNAVRIARTEGHRIQVQAGMDACYKAKEKGADVVKQWDSTLDAKTRDSHVKVDGEIKELDEKFSNGLMFPGDPLGGAAEVVNCRCALLQRARWAVGGSFTKMDNETGEIVDFKDIDDYNEFKKTYLKQSKEIENAMSQGVDVESEMMKFFDKRREQDGLSHTISSQEAKDINPDMFSFKTSPKMSDETNARIERKYNELLQKYKTTCAGVSYEDVLDMDLKAAMARGGTTFNQAIFQSRITILSQTEDELAEQLGKSIARKFNIKGLQEEDYPLYYLTHEFAHSIINVTIDPKNWSLQLSPSHIKKIRKFDDEITHLFTEYKSEINRLTLDVEAARKSRSAEWSKAFMNGDWEECSRIKAEIKVYEEALESVRISEYASKNPNEFMAESFALCELSTETSPYAEKVMKLIVENFGW